MTDAFDTLATAWVLSIPFMVYVFAIRRVDVFGAHGYTSKVASAIITSGLVGSAVVSWFGFGNEIFPSFSGLFLFGSWYKDCWLCGRAHSAKMDRTER
ncbi:MAG: hypothetical protein KDB27_08910 [Planctomycetales bacterium]|nr:hypothetical protein [Planctomycetales bacterium]